MGTQCMEGYLEPLLQEIVRENENLTRLVEQLQESEEKFRTIFDFANDLIIYMSLDGTVIDVNDKIEDIFGIRRRDVLGMNIYTSGLLTQINIEDAETYLRLRDDAIAGNPSPMREFRLRKPDGTYTYFEVNYRVIRKNGSITGDLAIIRDITRRKMDEENLRRHREQLEEMVRERTASLQEANAALKVLLRRIEEDKLELSDRMQFNIKELIVPYLEKLSLSKLTPQQETIMEILESNLDDIVAPYMHTLSSRFLNLTPTEIRVANLIIQGRTSKEISGIMRASKRTIDTHRCNIRRKMGIDNEHVNLRTRLMSLS